MKKSRYPENWRVVAMKIKAEANWVCQKCQKQCLPSDKLRTIASEIRPKSTLTVHHKDCNRYNLDKNNLIALCLTCHRRIHGLLGKPKLKNYRKQSKKN